MPSCERDPLLVPFIKKLLSKNDLTIAEAACAGRVMCRVDEEGDEEQHLRLHSQIAAFLVLHMSKGPTADELCGLRLALSEKSVKLTSVLSDCTTGVDIVGTGGDCANTINISTAAAFVVAACGVPVVKHGSRSVSSACGSADVLEALGAKIDENATAAVHNVEQSLKEVGFGFCYAPSFHPAMTKLKKIRRALNVPTAISLLGPLLNPADPPYLVIGVWDPNFIDTFLEVLRLSKKCKRAVVVHCLGLDELSPIGPSIVGELDAAGNTHKWTLDPVDYGIGRCELEDLQGGPPEKNAELMMLAFEGTGGAVADAIALNAGMALWICGRHELLGAAIEEARQALVSGAVKNIFTKWRDFQLSK